MKLCGSTQIYAGGAVTTLVSQSTAAQGTVDAVTPLMGVMVPVVQVTAGDLVSLVSMAIVVLRFIIDLKRGGK